MQSKPSNSTCMYVQISLYVQIEKQIHAAPKSVSSVSIKWKKIRVYHQNRFSED